MRDDDDLLRRYGGYQKKQQPQTRVSEAVAPQAERIQDAAAFAPAGRGAKKKNKYVNLYDTNNKDVLLPGRHWCECQATKHKLVTNCLGCGRIVCQQEGVGPCLHCGAPVPFDAPAAPARLEAIGELIAGVDPKLFKPRVVAMDAEGFRIAQEHKEKLLEYDRNSEQRTKVIDDELDYFSAESNIWLTPEQRKELMQKADEMMAQKHASRNMKGVRVTIDFAGRKVIQAADDVGAGGPGKTVLDTRVDGPLLGGTGAKLYGWEGETEQKLACASAVIKHEPKYEPTGEGQESAKQKREKQKGGWLLEKYVTRIQDKEIMEMADDGWCLSLHQPWASLLVAGVKRHEGRSWYSSHRGRLWIASTSKPVSPADIKELEGFYKHIYGEASWNQKMPNAATELWQSGCLVGCVDIADVMSQEEYRKQYPYGESSSPFVFICKNPRKLKIPIPVRGKHKIYQLERDILEAAKRNLVYAD